MLVVNAAATKYQIPYHKLALQSQNVDSCDNNKNA